MLHDITACSKCENGFRATHATFRQKSHTYSICSAVSTSVHGTQAHLLHFVYWIHSSQDKSHLIEQIKHCSMLLAQGSFEGAVDFILIFFFALLFFFSSSWVFEGDEVNSFDFSIFLSLCLFDAVGAGDSSSISDRHLSRKVFGDASNSSDVDTTSACAQLEMPLGPGASVICGKCPAFWSLLPFGLILSVIKDEANSSSENIISLSGHKPVT